MSELFSNERLIDYFTLFDIKVTSLIDNANVNITTNDYHDFFPLKVKYRHQVLKIYPKKIYKEKDMYELNLEVIFKMLTTENVYLKKPANKFFSLIFTNFDGKHYYGFFLKVYDELESHHPLYNEIKEINIPINKIYTPKYLAFFSSYPFFVSFKYILDELYLQSTINEGKCYKVENILNIILYRIYLPKYQSTQLSWALNDKVYTFSRNLQRTEISYKLMFSYISIEKVVLLYMAFLMNSIVIFFHTNIEILAPIIDQFMQLLFPFAESYSIINNLNPELKELIECPAGGIVIGVNALDYDNISEIICLINESNSNIVYYDFYDNKLILDNNEDMKNIDLLPKQRINNLIDNLCKHAEIYERDKNKIDEMKKLNIWENFQTVNDFNLSGNFSKHKRNHWESGISKKSTQNIYHKNLLINNSEKFSDEIIRSLFFEFNLGLIEAYDESRHYEINEETQDKTFLTEKFIEDSKLDIQKFLELIKENPSFDNFVQRITHVVDQRHKNELKKTDPKYFKSDFKMNPRLREACLISDFDKIYNMIITGLIRMKKSKSLKKLFTRTIYNTITIPSPKFEKLSYHQNNIFSDPMHEELMVHTESVALNKFKVDLSFVNIELKDQSDLNVQLLRDEIIHIYKKDLNTINNTNNTGTGKEGKSEIINLLKSISLEMNSKNPLTLDFKNYLITGGDLLKIFYGFLLSKIKNVIDQKEIKPITTKTEDMVNIEGSNAYPVSNSGNILKNLTHFKSNSITQNKQEFISNFNVYYNTYIKDRTNPMIEFHLSFGLNLIQSVAICEYCKRPNCIWDIRKEFIYYKLKRESQTKCKFCSQFFIPYFYILEESSEPEIMKNKKVKNKSFESENHFVIDQEVLNRNNLDRTKKLRRVEYLSYEHILTIFQESETDEKEKTTSRNKKFNYDLFYNVCLLLGEIKIRIEKNKNIELYTLENYMKRKWSKNNENLKDFDPNKNNMFYQEFLSNTSLSRNTVLKIFRDNYLKKKKEIENKLPQVKKERNKSKKKNFKSTQYAKYANKVPFVEEKIPIKEKMVNIKFDIKDLMNDKKYEKFESDLISIPHFNKKNVNKLNKNLLNDVNIFQNMTSRLSKENNAFMTIKSKDDHTNTNITTPIRLSKIEPSEKRFISPGRSRSRSNLRNSRLVIDLVDKILINTPSRSKSRSRSKNIKNMEIYSKNSRSDKKSGNTNVLTEISNDGTLNNKKFDGGKSPIHEEAKEDNKFKYQKVNNIIQNIKRYVSPPHTYEGQSNYKSYATLEQNKNIEKNNKKVKKAMENNSFLSKFNELAKSTSYL